VVVVVAVLVVVGLVAAGGLALLRSVTGTKDYSGQGTGSVSITVPDGASATRIARILTDAGVVASVEAFVEAAKDDPRSVTVQPGSYRMALRMSGDAALARLLDPDYRLTARVIVPEGSTVARTVEIIVRDTDITQAALEQALDRPAGLGLPAYADGEAEGFLFPSAYDVEPGADATSVLRQMTARFDETSRSIRLDARAKAAGRTPYDVLIVASIAQAEVAPKDYSKVARVVYNRLAKGMRLQLDTTVNYARGRKDLKLSLSDIAIDSPYNTYRVSGLPPTPINSPSKEAIEAALSPATGDWIYFVTTDIESQSTTFTSSYEEFLKAKAEFERANP
jgi:UPF0755 protein